MAVSKKSISGASFDVMSLMELVRNGELSTGGELFDYI